ncbi:MAG: hypothetical protein R2716_02245 [Microthrixaceae bacterium]
MGSLIVRSSSTRRSRCIRGVWLTFGRDANLVVDPANQHLHRVLGSFVSREDGWSAAQRQAVPNLVVTDSTSRTEIRPGDGWP